MIEFPDEESRLRVKRILIVSAIFMMAFEHIRQRCHLSVFLPCSRWNSLLLERHRSNFGTCMSSSPSGAEAGGSVTLTDNSLEMAAYSDHTAIPSVHPSLMMISTASL